MLKQGGFYQDNNGMAKLTPWPSSQSWNWVKTSNGVRENEGVASSGLCHFLGCQVLDLAISEDGQFTVQDSVFFLDSGT